MEALQRMMTRRLTEHSYKRNAKRLMTDEFANEVDFDSSTQMANLNPAFEIFHGDIVWARNDSDNFVTDGTFYSPKPAPAIISPFPVNHRTEPTSIVTVSDDCSRTDKLLQKVSIALRRKLTIPKTSVDEQRSAYKVSASDDESHWKVTRNDAEKPTVIKSTRKMIDLVDIYAVGRKNRSEHRQLLSEDYDDE